MIVLKKVLVTGASGFLGSNLIKELVNRGFYVNAFIHNELKELKPIYDKNKDKIKIIKGDILDPFKIEEAIQGVDIIFHLAGISSTTQFINDPELCSKIDVEGTKNLLEIAKTKKINKIIIISSALLYKNSIKEINEDGEITLENKYVESKRKIELLSLDYFNSYHLPIIIIRLFNVYGERQSTKALIPKLIKESINGNEICIDCSVEKNFTYISDAIDALIQLISSNVTGEIINLGSQKLINLEKIVFLIEKELGKKLRINYINKNERKKIFKCDNSKLCSIINWKTKINIEKGIKKTVKYIRKNNSFD